MKLTYNAQHTHTKLITLWMSNVLVFIYYLFIFQNVPIYVPVFIL